jgi:hypothetical protein
MEKGGAGDGGENRAVKAGAIAATPVPQCLDGAQGKAIGASGKALDPGFRHYALTPRTGVSIMAYVVKVYDPSGTVPASYRSARNTWVMSPAAEPLRLFATESAARAFIAIHGPFTALEMCVETAPANLMNPTQKITSPDVHTLP